uniref:Uncharacterized protein n=1 Tax=Amphimedon queenslandica TaxID=400682 RepID=A0A1X7UHT2_AMPQE
MHISPYMIWRPFCFKGPSLDFIRVCTGWISFSNPSVQSTLKY